MPTDSQNVSQRKTAPRVQVWNFHVDERAKLIGELEAANPKLKYLFERGDIKPDELARKGYEAVLKDGAELRVPGGDLVVCTDAEAWNERLRAECEFSRQQLEARVEPEQSTVKRSPKEPKFPRGEEKKG